MTTPRTEKNGQLIPRSAAPKDDLPALLQRMAPEISKAVPRHINPERLLRVALTSLRMNPDLMRCSKASFLGSVLTAAQLGLEIGGPLGLCYLVPYKGNAQLIVGYQGFIELARRSGSVTAVYAHEVREGDKFKYTLGLNPTLEHEPAQDGERESRPVTHVYAVAKLRDAEPIFVVLTKAQVDARRDRSAARASGPWVTDPVPMMWKTAVRALFRWLPKTPELAVASAVDEAADIGTGQLAAWDPTVTEALQSHGVAVEEAETDGEPAPEASSPS